jgi:hypothetical protein
MRSTIEEALRTGWSKVTARARLPWRKEPEAELAPMTGSLEGRVSFATGTGRCGTHFIAKLMEHEPEVAAIHERDPLLQAFHRYCKWYELPIDDEGFLQTTEAHIRRDLARHQLSFESSPTLAMSITELDQRFAPRFVFLVRHPRDVVKSYLHKGWYEAPMVQQRPELALGYQAGRKFQHFLGRIAPRGDEFAPWNRLTRVGKLAWYWSALNRAALAKAKAIPAERWRMYKLEDFDFAKYQEVATYFGFSPRLTAQKFDEIRHARPGAQKNIPPAAWTDQEWSEFERYAKPLADELGYTISRSSTKRPS